MSCTARRQTFKCLISQLLWEFSWIPYSFHISFTYLLYKESFQITWSYLSPHRGYRKLFLGHKEKSRTTLKKLTQKKTVSLLKRLGHKFVKSFWKKTGRHSWKGRVNLKLKDFTLKRFADFTFLSKNRSIFDLIFIKLSL